MTVQQRLANAVDVAEVVGTVRRHVRRRMLQTLAVELMAGSQTLGELDVAEALRGRGLPPPSRQSVKTRKDGTQYLDLEWPESHLVLEIDGLGHEAPAQA